MSKYNILPGTLYALTNFSLKKYVGDFSVLNEDTLTLLKFNLSIEP